MSTSDPYWRTKEVFAEALDQPPERRDAWLRARCAADQQLYDEVRSMLAAHAAASAVVGHVATPPVAHARADEFLGTTIGQYRIVEVIGEGGMGVVYKAEQRAPVRRVVALKLIKLGMDTREVIARFDGERRALALMNHPNVAAVYDAGATDRGRPYFVMEHVPGTPITSFCDRQRYTTRQRLELFTQACDAIQHAHTKGIIHRDVKPSNVLVTLADDLPRVKVIDFGIAKAVSQRLTEHAVFTETGQLIGTPEYMSPEQADLNPVDVDTRTDIYSLGIVLYELLAGALPFESKSLRRAAYAQIRAIIREVDPPRPSTRLSGLGEPAREIARLRQTPLAALQRELRGELEWIPLKAMRKDRAHRYHTAEQFAQDIRNYLSQRPLVAGPESPVYRARKFVRRNRVSLLTATAVLVCALAGIGLYIHNIRAEQRRTQDALAEAQRQRNEARNKAAIAKAVGEFQSDMLASADPDRMLGNKVTVVQVTRAALNELDGGKLNDQPLVEASVRETIGKTLRELGEYDEAEPVLLKALQLRRSAAGPADVAVAASLFELGRLAQFQGRLAEAEQRFRRALDILDGDPSLSNRYTIANLCELADTLRRLGKLAEAESVARRAADLARRTSPPDARDLANNINTLALVLNAQGKLAESESLQREALAIYRAALPAAHQLIGVSLNNLASVLQDQGKLADAEPCYREALQIQRAILPAAHPILANTLNNLACLVRDQGRLVEAEGIFREALEIQRTSLPPEHLSIAITLNNLAVLLQRQRNFDAAESSFRESLRIQRKALPPAHLTIAKGITNLALLLVEAGKPAEAEPFFREALAIFTGTPNEQSRSGNCRASLGRVLVELRRYAEAETELLHAERMLATSTAPPAQRERCIQHLVALYDAWDKAESGRGYDAKAAQWGAKLPATQPTTAPAASPATLPAAAVSDGR